MGSVGFVKLAPIESINFLITDTDAEGELKAKLDEAEVKIIKV